MLFGRFLRQKGSLATAQMDTGPIPPVKDDYEDVSDDEPPLPPLPPSPKTYNRSKYTMSLNSGNNERRVQLISSKSPPNGWPKTLEAYVALYRDGKIDFEFPPPFPQALNNDFATETGQMRSPRPACERARQRSVDSLEIYTRPKQPASRPPRKLSTIVDDEEDEAEVVISEKVSEGEAEKFAELEEIAFRTGQIFQADASLSLMSYDSQIFIAGREGCIDRDNTVCSHALLKGTFTDEAFVSLDISKDIRFEHNNYPTLKFYASAPIYAPPAFGEPAPHFKGQPIGVLCLLSTSARDKFSAAERSRLRNLADQAGDALAVLKVKKAHESAAYLEKERRRWREQVKEALKGGGIGSGMRASSKYAVERDFFVGGKEPVISRKKSVNSAEERLATRCSSKELTTKTRDLLQLSLQLLTESLESFSFSYIVSLPVAAQTPALEEIPSFVFAATTPIIPIRLLAAHNLPTPPPFFNLKIHHQVLVGKPLLFHSTASPREDDLADGVVIPISNGMLLGIFQTFGSQGERRSLTGTDFLFIEGCLADLRVILAEVRV